MIQRVVEGAKKSTKLAEVVVATDDQRIYDHVLSFGGKCFMTSESHPSGTDRCGEVAKQLDADVIINVQGDEPLIDARQLDALCEAFEDGSVSIATLAIPDNDLSELKNPNRIKLIRALNGDALYFSRSVIPNAERANKPAAYLRHIGVYAYRSRTLQQLIQLEPSELEKTESLEQLRWLENGHKIRVVLTDIETPNIDTPEDVQSVLNLL